jgi:SAM-dependent methyltransferase
VVTIQEVIQQHLDRYEKQHGPQEWGRALNFGCGKSPMKSTDRTEWVNVDRLDELEFNINEFDLIVGWHVLEHIPGYELLAVMQELWDRAKPNALGVFEVPHGAHDMAWENPTHVRAMFPMSWLYFGQPTYHREDYGYEGDWRLEHVEINVPNDLFLTADAPAIHERVKTERNVALEMRGYMRCNKPARAQVKELMDRVDITYLGVK